MGVGIWRERAGRCSDATLGRGGEGMHSSCTDTTPGLDAAGEAQRTPCSPAKGAPTMSTPEKLQKSPAVPGASRPSPRTTTIVPPATGPADGASESQCRQGARHAAETEKTRSALAELQSRMRKQKRQEGNRHPCVLAGHA